MTSPSVAAVLARVQHVARRHPVTGWPPGLVFQLACELGVTLRARPDGLLHVQGPELAVAFLLPALRVHKVALLAGPCVRCRHNLAETDDRLCRWCDAVRGRTYVYEPDSAAERDYLARLAATNSPNEMPLRHAA